MEHNKKQVTEAQKQLIYELLDETSLFGNDSELTKLIFEIMESNDRFAVIRMIHYLLGLTHWYKSRKLVDEIEAERALEERAEELRCESVCNRNSESFPEMLGK